MSLSLDSYFLKRMKKNDKFTFHAREADVIITDLERKKRKATSLGE